MAQTESNRKYQTNFVSTRIRKESYEKLKGLCDSEDESVIKVIGEAIDDCLKAIEKSGGVLAYRFHRQQKAKQDENKPSVSLNDPRSNDTPTPKKANSKQTSQAGSLSSPQKGKRGKESKFPSAKKIFDEKSITKIGQHMEGKLKEWISNKVIDLSGADTTKYMKHFRELKLEEAQNKYSYLVRIKPDDRQKIIVNFIKKSGE